MSGEVQQRPLRVALTGGIACGKSLVARYLREAGIETLDADDVVHELLPDPEERRRIAAEVFADAEKRKALEARLHPLVKARLQAFLAASGTGGLPRVAIVPLLFEAHWEGDFDFVCCVTSPREVQVARMVEKRGYSREEAEARLAAQWPVAEKAAKSDYIIENAAALRDLEARVRAFVETLRSHAQRGSEK